MCVSISLISTKLNNKMKSIIETPNAPEPIDLLQVVLSGNTLYTLTNCY